MEKTLFLEICQPLIIAFYTTKSVLEPAKISVCSLVRKETGNFAVLFCQSFCSLLLRELPHFILFASPHPFICMKSANANETKIQEEVKFRFGAEASNLLFIRC